MSKKVVVISSSPRRGGNSDILCDQFITGAHSAGHQVEKFFLKDKKINYCTGCGVCLNGEKSCPQKDDMADLLSKLIAADIIVMATPVYFYTMCGQMKTFIDRICARYIEVKNKDFYFIVTAADSNKQALDKTIEEFRGFLDCLDNPSEKGIVYGTSAWNIGEIKNSKAMSQALEMGINI
ncbi:flavodoxin family protein [uncultured Acetobacteroides sp.]|uniref:flavodoxin family protein n=1 Tax=uncultured Acetobacteroides sp. TaxID=1760811 RepID=UPI0029F4BC1C|nr:flavodoxin family protein [uncultured Acetobacteroides sp.]